MLRCVCIVYVHVCASLMCFGEFFKQTFSELLDPLARLHFNVEVSVHCALHVCVRVHTLVVFCQL